MTGSEGGFDLTFRSPKAEGPVVIEDDAPNFAHVILLAPEARSAYEGVFVSLKMSDSF